MAYKYQEWLIILLHCLMSNRSEKNTEHREIIKQQKTKEQEFLR